MHLPQPLLIQPKSTRLLAFPAVLGQHPNCSIPLEVAKVRFLLALSLTGFHDKMEKKWLTSLESEMMEWYYNFGKQEQ